MNTPGLCCLAIAGALLVADSASPAHQSRTTFVGTTPCGAALLAFMGGMAAGAPCQAIRWELTLGTPDAPHRWSLAAAYAVPNPSNPTAMVEGPKVTKQGTFTTSAVQRLGASSTVFRLAGDTGSSISFAQLGADLVHLAGDDGSLVPGTPAWTYTLTRADRLEPPAIEVARGPEGSYSIPPKETGPHVFAIFGGRSPCGGLARELRLSNAGGCVRLKWRVTLLQDPATKAPTTYRVDNSLTRSESWTGRWRIVRGTPAFPDASVYQLDAYASHGPILLLRVDDNLVLFLNQQRQPLPGTADFSYTLTRSQ